MAMDSTGKKKKLKGTKSLMALGLLIAALLVQKFTGLDVISLLNGPGQESPGVAAQAAQGTETAGQGVDFVYKQFKAHRSSVWVTTEGKVKLLLADDNKGSRHQQFILELDAARKFTVKVAHNIDDAPYVPLKRGDTIQIKGRYEFNEIGGVIHFTHRADRPTKRTPGGWIEYKGQRYQ